MFPSSSNTQKSKRRGLPLSAIKSGKEHRVEYGTKNQPYCKAVDPSCRNHGSCLWCLSNRTYKNKRSKTIALEKIKEYKNLGNNEVL